MAFYTLSQLQSEVLNRLKTHNGLVNNDRITRWANETIDEISIEFEPDHLYREEEFSSVVGTSVYFLKLEFNKILTVVDVDGNDVLEEMTRADFDTIDPDRNDSSRSPWAWIKQPLTWVSAQPTSASLVTIVSSATGDNSQVRISGIAGGVEDTELLTLDGTTPVPGGLSFTEVFTVTKNARTDGAITATSNAAVVTIVIIPKDSFAREFQPFRFYPGPSAIRTYRFRGIRRPRQLIYAQDHPDLPEMFHELVVLGCLIRGHNDLFKPTIAEQIRDNEYEPLRKKLKAQTGQRRSRRARRVRGRLPGGRLFDHHERHLIKRVPDLLG